MKIYLDKVKIIRKQQKLTIQEVADLMSISRSTINAWIAESRSPTEAQVRLLAKILNIDVSEISDLEPDKPVSETNISLAASSSVNIANDDLSSDMQTIQQCLGNIQNDLSNTRLILNGINKTIDTMYYVKNYNMKYISTNKAFLKQTGMPIDYPVIGKSDFDFFSEKEAKENEEIDIKVITSGNEYKSESYIPGTRKTKWGITLKKPIYDNEHKILGLISTYTDITERKKLELSRELLDKNINLTNDCVWIRKEKGTFIYLNKAIENVYGYPVEEFTNIGFWVKNCLHPDYYDTWKKCLDSKQFPKLIEFKIIKPDGTERWIEANIISKEIDNENYISSIERDITQKKELEKVRDLLKLNISIMNDYVCIISYNPDEVVYSNISSLIENGDYFLSEQSSDFEWINHCHPDDLKTQKSYIKNKSWPESDIYRIIHPKTKNIHWFKRTTQKTNVDGRDYFYFIESDITKELEEKKIADSFRDALSLSGDILWVINDYNENHYDIKFSYVSDNTKDLMGVSVTQLKNNPFSWLDNVSHLDLDKVKEWIEIDEYPKEVKFRYNTVDAPQRWIRARCHHKDSMYYITATDISNTVQEELEMLIRSTSEIVSNEFIWIFSKARGLLHFIGSPTEVFGIDFDVSNGLETWENKILDKKHKEEYVNWYKAFTARDKTLVEKAKNSKDGYFKFDNEIKFEYQANHPNGQKTFFRTSSYYLAYRDEVYYISFDRNVTDEHIFKSKLDSIKELIASKGDLSESDKNILNLIKE